MTINDPSNEPMEIPAFAPLERPAEVEVGTGVGTVVETDVVLKVGPSVEEEVALVIDVTDVVNKVELAPFIQQRIGSDYIPFTDALLLTPRTLDEDNPVVIITAFLLLAGDIINYVPLKNIHSQKAEIYEVTLCI